MVKDDLYHDNWKVLKSCIRADTDKSKTVYDKYLHGALVEKLDMRLFINAAPLIVPCPYLGLPIIFDRYWPVLSREDKNTVLAAIADQINTSGEGEEADQEDLEKGHPDASINLDAFFEWFSRTLGRGEMPHSAELTKVTISLLLTPSTRNKAVE